MACIALRKWHLEFGTLASRVRPAPWSTLSGMARNAGTKSVNMTAQPTVPLFGHNVPNNGYCAIWIF
jgi:hypothetical protein